MHDSNDLLEEVLSLTNQAGEKILSYYGKIGIIKNKGGNSPLTKADLESNEILSTGLKQFGYPIVSEEGKEDKARFSAKRVWIIDPLDGTKDFLQETGEFTVMVALVEKNEQGKFRPILGVIYSPVSKIFYYAIKDEGAWMRNSQNESHKLSVSTEKELSNITMLTSRNHTTDLEREIASKLRIKKVKAFGSSLKVCLIAEQKGHVNFNAAPYTWEWDVCASDIIIHEAGGCFTDSEGRIFDYNKKDLRNHDGYLASNGGVHEVVLENIKELSTK